MEASGTEVAACGAELLGIQKKKLEYKEVNKVMI